MEILSFAANPDRFGPTVGSYSGPILSARNLLIHGYHNDPLAAVDSYNILQSGLGQSCAGLIWPGMRLFAEFPFAIINATQAGWRLKDLLRNVNGLGKLTIQTHSLGARVACEALKYDVKIHRLILSAPAIDQDAFNGEFKQVLANVDRIDVAFSKNDPVLEKDYPFGTLFHHAMGLHGSSISAANLFNHDYSEQVSSHGGYKTCKEYLDMWRVA